MSGHVQSPLDDHTLRVHQLYARHQHALLAYVLSLEPKLDDAEEIVQETFLTASRKASQWSDGTNYFAWVCAIARYCTLEYRRSRKKQQMILADDVFELVYQGGDADLAELEHRAAILGCCLEQLAPRAKQIMMLRYHAGHLPEEIASMVGWSVNSVRVALTRAKDLLRNCLKRQLPSEAMR